MVVVAAAAAAPEAAPKAGAAGAEPEAEPEAEKREGSGRRGNEASPTRERAARAARSISATMLAARS